MTAAPEVVLAVPRGLPGLGVRPKELVVLDAAHGRAVVVRRRRVDCLVRTLDDVAGVLEAVDRGLAVPIGGYFDRERLRAAFGLVPRPVGPVIGRPVGPPGLGWALID